jgi:tRNA dimethylallyltransferase
MAKPKIVVILGPTATGKSDLAVKLAKKFKGEVISADSRQVYKGLNLGTGKITKEEMKDVSHHLLDVANPKKQYSVADFQKNAQEAINDIVARGRLPIVCGGTGFYISSIVDNTILPEVPADKKLRASLSKKSATQLFAMLKKIDPQRAKNIDAQNPVRLIRAIEIAKALGKVPELSTKKSSLYKVLQIGINLCDEELKPRIHKRIITRMDAGMINEAKKLHKDGLSYRRMRALGLEYRNLADLIEKKINKKQFVEILSMDICHYVRRQRQWWKKDKRISWHSPRETRQIEKEVKDFLS